MYVLGVSCQTDNADAMKDIGELWARAGAAGLLSGTPMRGRPTTTTS